MDKHGLVVTWRTRRTRAGFFLLLLAILHAAALIYWLYLLSLSPSLAGGAGGGAAPAATPRQFKKLRAVYDFLDSSDAIVKAGSRRAHRLTPESVPMKRNRSYPNVQSASASHAGL